MKPQNNISRRNLIKSSLALTAGSALSWNNHSTQTIEAKSKHRFTYSLNTSTISRQNLGLIGEIELAAKAGYDGIEIWIRTLDTFIKNGGKLKDVKKRADDLGLKIVDAIGFAMWMVDDPNQRAEALEQAKREMSMLAEIGCPRMAAPPFGATNTAALNLQACAARYHHLLELGKEMNVKPQLEMWGFSTNIYLFGQALFIAAESGHADACILADVYHLYKGGSSDQCLQMVDGKKIEIFHMNDYPADKARNKINDSHRIYPGDGIAPITSILKELKNKNTEIILSLELFNEEYWKQDAATVAKTGLSKMKNEVAKAVLA